MNIVDDTITAIATPPGKGGVGIVRVSGPKATVIARAIINISPTPRVATFTPFYDDGGTVMDEGIALYFKAPHSFTGEDVLELQGHGGPIILDRVLKRVIALGARLARPGEFSERAFLNDKMDLTQAEAVADLINAESEQAARCAVRSLQGEFSKTIHALVDRLIHLRTYVEAAIDFPEEEIDFLKDSTVVKDAEAISQSLDEVLANATQGVLLREGMTVVIAGPPNAGKSSLLNALSGRDSAIVTDIAGTTRDVLREMIHIDGLPLHIVDTAGLRESDDVVEQEGVLRAKREMEKADVVLLMQDIIKAPLEKETYPVPTIYVMNKIDLVDQPPHVEKENKDQRIYLSIKTGEGLDALKQALKAIVGFEAQTEGQFIARRRHLDALKRAKAAVQHGIAQLKATMAGELLAEDLRVAQAALSEITGEFSSDDLLGEIFSSFCIGK